MKQVAFVDSKILRGSDACIPVDDLGLQRAYAVFDYARMYNGRLFHIHDHIARFRRSAAGLHLELDYTDEEIIRNAMILVDELNVENAGLRLLLTGGPAHGSTLFDQPRFIMIAEQLPEYPSHVFQKGVKLMTYEFQRDLPHVKTTNYMNAFRLEPLKREKKAYDILYVWQGKVLECPRDNFFIVRGNKLITAKDNVLHGVTRKVIFELARDDFTVEERDVAVEELDVADEAFLTSTTKQTVPVVQVDDRKIGDGKVGECTRTIIMRFQDYIDSY
ncbi:MAG: aminotransferase class IV family protein [Candidatus Latescibacterota bacterium]|nr:MAG: aminotransferase class IV family protein [Candidatus Latescibacterota bacterium]